MTASGTGYDTDGPITVWAYPGDPVTAQCWSNINNCDGGANLAGNHRMIPSSPTFSLAPGESKTFDVAYLFAQGESNLDSITELRAASDLVQAAYDDGSLFDPVAPVAAESAAPNPSALTLGPVYPNPLSATRSASVPLTLNTSAEVSVRVFDVLGREVATLHDGPLGPGTHRFQFAAHTLRAGAYVVRVSGASDDVTRTFTVIR